MAPRKQWVVLGLSMLAPKLLGPATTGYYLVLLGATGYYWVLLGITGYYWVLLGDQVGTNGYDELITEVKYHEIGDVSTKAVSSAEHDCW